MPVDSRRPGNQCEHYLPIIDQPTIIQEWVNGVQNLLVVVLVLAGLGSNCRREGQTNRSHIGLSVEQESLYIIYFLIPHHPW